MGEWLRSCRRGSKACYAEIANVVERKGVLYSKHWRERHRPHTSAEVDSSPDYDLIATVIRRREQQI